MQQTGWRDRATAVLAAARREWLPLLVLALAGSAGWLFLALAGEVVEGDTHAIDERILLAFRTVGDPSDPIGPDWFEEIMRDLTALGGYAVLSMLTTGVLGLLLMLRRWRDAALVTASVVGSAALTAGLKEWFDRPRPALVPHESVVYTMSFPSGHAMISAAVYLTLAAVLARTLPRRQMRAYVLAWGLGVVGVVGLSRVYLGVHWPSDVLGGWAGGASWALGTWAVATWWSRPAVPREG